MLGTRLGTLMKTGRRVQTKGVLGEGISYILQYQYYNINTTITAYPLRNIPGFGRPI